RRELELLLLPVGSLPTVMTCPLRSTSITPASSLLQGSPPLSGASVLSASRLEPLAPFPLTSPARFSRSTPTRESHGKSHPTARIDCHTWRRGGRMTARCARAEA